jgi:uncharacterized SAM-binding protein YcdF (DUF218 family)/lysophospholipase L1-like esterase
MIGSAAMSAPEPPPRPLRLRRRAAPVRQSHRFLAGFLVGVASVFGVRWITNNTRVADILVSPLLSSDTRGRGDVIVVLAAAVNEQCSPNLFSIRRVMFAKQAFAEGRAPRLLIAGGQSDGPCAVSRAMADLAVQLGVPADRIDIERESRSTWENAALSDPLLRAMGAQRIVLVTDQLHMKRAEACFRHFGYAVDRVVVPVSESHADNVSMLELALREAVALAYYEWKGRLSVRAASTAPAGDAARAASGSAPSATMHIQPAFPEGPVVILGASYAHGWNPGIAGRRTVNKGLNGQQSWELRERFDRDVVAERPRAVVIWGFFNDIVRSARPKMDDTLDRVRQSVSGMVEAARTARIEPILATEVTMRHPDTWSDSIKATVGWLLGRQSYQEYINSYIVRTNQWLREYAVREGLLLLDLQPVVSDRDGRRQRAFAAPDGSHISPAGYDALTRYASPLIASRLSAQ